MTNRVREFRLKHQLTQEFMSRHVDISLRQYCNIEYNINRPSVDIAIKIAELFNVPVELLFSDKKRE